MSCVGRVLVDIQRTSNKQLLLYGWQGSTDRDLIKSNVRRDEVHVRCQLLFMLLLLAMVETSGNKLHT
jgi:hypothetical protein